MEQQLLELESLRLQSIFSSMPVADYVNMNGSLMPLVAVHKWVMPKACFVTVWMWFMLEGKAYYKNFDHAAWDPVLELLNPEQLAMIPSNTFKKHVIDIIFTTLYQEYHPLNLTLSNRRDMFTRVIHSLDPSLELMAA